MTLAWFHWWWSPIGLDRAQVVLGAVGALLAVAAVLYAWRVARRQFTMMEEQGKIIDKQLILMKEQTEADKRVAELTVDLKAILSRQGEIAEVQHALMQEQLAKNTDLRVIIPGVKSHFESDLGVTFTVRFNVHNGGNKSADGFYWEILVPEEIAHWIDFVDEDGDTLEGKISHQSNTEHYKTIDGHYTHKLWGYTGVEVARISFKPLNDKLEQFTLKWRIRGEDGMVPPEGLAFISLKRHDNVSYGWSEWHPGQKESDIQ